MNEYFKELHSQDGKLDSRELTKKVSRILKDMYQKGGGILIVYPGIYCVGSIRLYSNITIFLQKGAVLKGSIRRDEFPLLDENIFYGREKGARSALLWAANAENIKLCGEGMIDGSGENWWSEQDGKRPCILEFGSCHGICLEGIRIQNSPYWTIHFFQTQTVSMKGLSIYNPPTSPNTDGIDVESSGNVEISHCTINVGDDCIALKSGKESDKMREFLPTENVRITCCRMERGHGGIVIGSEVLGGVRNVYAADLKLYHTDRGIRIKTKRIRGGKIEDITAERIYMEDVICPIVINCYYRGTTRQEDYEVCSDLRWRQPDKHTPVIERLYFKNIKATGIRAAAAYIQGLPESPVNNCIFRGLNFEMSEEGEEEEPAMTYERKKMHKYGFYVRNMIHTVMENVKVKNAIQEMDIS